MTRCAGKHEVMAWRSMQLHTQLKVKHLKVKKFEGAGNNGFYSHS